jgi:hypothetical protein
MPMTPSVTLVTTTSSWPLESSLWQTSLPWALIFVWALKVISNVANVQKVKSEAPRSLEPVLMTPRNLKIV